MDSSGISAENPPRSGVPSATEALVSVIVPVRDMDSDARALLEALDQQTVPREQYEVILADDGSVSRSIAELATPDDHVRVLMGPRANSYAARNRAIAAARGRLIATCDADCRPERDWLERGISALRRADIVAGLIRFRAPDRPTIWGILDMTTFLDQRRAVKAGYGVTANLLFRRDLFDRLGGFDASQPNQGDYDFVRRCVARGGNLVFSPEAAVWHPARNRPSSFLRKLWAVNRRYAEREAMAGRKPERLKVRNWVPVVQTLRARRRAGRPLTLDRERLAESNVFPTMWDEIRALPLIYLVLPYLSGLAQLRGWAGGRAARSIPRPQPNGSWIRGAFQRVSFQTAIRDPGADPAPLARTASLEPAELLLVCSPGGHLLQLLQLRAAWGDFSRVWVTLDRSDTRSLLDGEQVVHAHGPTFRNVKNLILNLWLAWRVISAVRPAAILTTGPALAVPFSWIGRLRGSRIVYVESFTRVSKPSLSCRLVRPVANRLYVQWPELQKALPSARYVGNVFSIQ